MTIEATSEKVGRLVRRTKTPPATAMPIGESDANIFNCPDCARPLGKGVSRCPGCGTRLMAGVKLSRAMSFMLVGLATGVLVGGGVMAGVFGLGRPVDLTAAQPPAVVTPSQVPVATAGTPVGNPAIPTAAVSGLRQSTVLNQRLVADAKRLAQALAASRPTGSEIAPILRSFAGTAAFGQGVAPDIADWDDGAAVSAGLVAFYEQVSSIAADGLKSSVKNPAAYVAAAARMLDAMAGLTDLDAASRTLAATADVDLPVLDPGAESAP
jgi:hypothetical protein